MEDDDEFGDLYTDVLGPFSSTSTTTSLSSLAPQPFQPSPTPTQLLRPIDLNLQSQHDGNTLFGAPAAQTLAPFKSPPPPAVPAEAEAPDSIPSSLGSVTEPMVLDSKHESGDGKELEFDVEEGGGNGIEDIGSNDPLIPGLTEVVRQEGNNIGIRGSQAEADGERDDWDSDSEDDLQIVLNDNNHGPVAMETGEMIGEDDDDDEDGDPLVILADGDANQGTAEQEWGEERGQAADGEKKEGGEAGKVTSGGVLAPKIGYSSHLYHPFHSQFKLVKGLNSKTFMDEELLKMKNYVPKYLFICESSNLCSRASTETSAKKKCKQPVSKREEPVESNIVLNKLKAMQQQYVRPGATPMPGATAGGSGGAPGQVSPIMGAMAGRGRGDWRPSGMKAGPPMQKGFHPSFGAPGRGNNTAGRGFGGGLEFTLPSHKTIFDVDIDSFEEKPWKYPGVDLSDFFNFGLNEESWKDYCKQLEQHRLETTMQSKIRVYESGRTEQGYDPDLPPELAAATAQVVPAAANLVKSDGGQNDMTKGAGRVRPPLPTGRPIQVEGGSGERLPSIDTRPPRVRDSDAVIEIVCEDTLDDDSSTGNGVEGRAENDLPMEDLRGDLASEAAIAHEDTEYFDDSADACKSRKKELVGRTVNFAHDNVREVNGVLPFPVEASRPYGPGPRVQSPMGPSENSGSPPDER
ncbi:hypothetical protein GOBAR_AA22486 [Gossypium barbadense]|uniref:Pre-mRNA polyadenylation factor Fip1 domain-containing protein n=1 Tax=Gossypium barbadense TaxID=3634 RepID=A0A2P5X491_GOSBA|nr:hypothetical protein GOBAR_AA22486 [Gossypium barbadense]